MKTLLDHEDSLKESLQIGPGARAGRKSLRKLLTQALKQLVGICRTIMLVIAVCIKSVEGFETVIVT